MDVGRLLRETFNFPFMRPSNADPVPWNLGTVTSELAVCGSGTWLWL